MTGNRPLKGPRNTMRKPFDPAAHQAFDKLGRDRVRQFFQDSYGIELQDNADPYGVDLIAYRAGVKVGYVEVEVRESWSADEFPFDSLHIPERKQKLLDNDLKTVLVSVNLHGTRAFICNAEVILHSPRMERGNKHVNSGELFFLVDPSQVKQVFLRNGT